MIPVEGHENAFFLSLQMKRMSVRSVEKLVKKYAVLVTPLKKITPHKLRSTYGTTLYQETGDIYLVADVLGHSDVNTTRKHYAAMEDSRRRTARNAVQLRTQPGDTIWSIAETYTQGTDISVEDYVQRIKQMNHLGEDTIHAGHYLTVMYQRPEAEEE